MLTDIVQSTAKWSRHPEAMQSDLVRHDALVRGCIERHGGNPFKHTGDGLLAHFADEEHAFEAARDIQASVEVTEWRVPGDFRLKIGVLTGPASEREGDYFGPTLNKLARLVEFAQGGQSLYLCEKEICSDGLKSLGRFALPKLEGEHDVFQICRAGEPDFPPRNLAESRFDNLPFAPSELIGRQAEIDRLVAEKGERLITLTGPGGIGKSRIALEFADERRPTYANGVVWIDLCCICVADEIASLIWEIVAAGEPEPPGLKPVLFERLRRMNLLLVLDGAEPLISAVASFCSELRTQAPGVDILITSREPLGIAGERVIGIQPLSVVGENSPAVELFLERARVVADFEPGPKELESVRELVRQLDGIPLAIEIAASRLRTMSIDSLRMRFESRFGVLQAAQRAGEERHRTLFATFDWSYDLLSPDERVAFCLLGIFPARFSFDAAAAMMSGRFSFAKAEALVESLVEKSMIAFDRSHPSAPFNFLDSLRQYSGAKREEEGLHEEARRAHAEATAAFAAETTEILRGHDASGAMDTIHERLGDLNAAAEFLWKVDPVRFAEVVRVMWRYWYRQGRVQRALQELEHYWKRMSREGLTEVELDARRSYGWALDLAGRAKEALAVAAEAVEDALKAGSPRDIAQARNLHAGCLMANNAAEQAVVEYNLALAAADDRLDPLGRARIQVNLGSAYMEAGQYDEAMNALSEALKSFIAVGDQYGQAWAMVSLGNVLIAKDKLPEAETMMRNSFILREELGDQRGQAYALLGLAELRLIGGEADLARNFWRKAAGLIIDIDDAWAIVETLLMAAKFVEARDDDALLGRILKSLDERSTGIPRRHTPREVDFLKRLREKAKKPAGEAEDPFDLARELLETI